MNDMSDLDFRKVTYKRKNSKLRKNKPHEHNNLSGAELDLESVLKRISEAKIEISSTDTFASLVASVKEGLSGLGNPAVSKIICLGLGKIGECLTARYQFVAILNLSELFNIKIFAYDPIFTEYDKKILLHFNVSVLTDNLEGKYKAIDKKTILFYMPHCPKQLTNNLLWTNWGLDLEHCVIIANSFTKIIESNSSQELEAKARYILKIEPYVLEVAIINNFKYYEIFNDTAVHVFPKLNFLCKDLWRDCLEPTYLKDDLEFITN